MTPVVGFTVREAHLDDSGCWDHGAPHPARRRTGFVFVRESSLGRLHGDIRSLPTSKERVPTAPPSATVLVFRFLAIGMLFFGLRSSKRLVERFGKPQREFPRLPPKVSLAATCQWFWEAAVQIWCLQVLNKNDPGVVKSRYQLPIAACMRLARCLSSTTEWTLTG